MNIKSRLKTSSVALLMVAVVSLLIIPLPTAILDFMFILNITISLVILFITMYIKETLEFAIFPSLLLVTTVYRLSLNISSTRSILTNSGYAGEVVKTFGEFVIQGNIVVGLIIFLILVLVQFIVITKGADRVAEVAARFTLDALPGKQMAIDADLSSGLITEEQAREKVKDPLYFGCLIIKNGDADGQISGALSTTGDTLRPALQIIKCAPGITTVSGAMLMITQAKEYGEDGVLVIGDVAVTPMPNADQLAQIAVCTAQTAKSVAGFADPRVAMLSFSTKGSAKHEVVDKVIEATRIAHEMEPELKLDGELQADAALVASVGEKKCPGSPIAGHANVLIAPSLEVGNISYKLVQRLGGADAIGPILQGIARPVNDLSRGCSVDDIYKMVAITACQAMDAK